MRRWVGIFVFLLLLVSVAEARKITIIQATRVELRPSLATPDGRTEEYIVIVGNPAVIKVDEDEITADRIEYNKTTRKLRIVGAGVFQGKNDTIAGRDFEVDLESEGLSAADVLISTTEIDVQGINCERLPGQVNVQNGYFSPCSRCGTTKDAYGFKARELTLYPGDRLIARDVTILLGGVPIMYLPIVVVFLSEPSRYPRLELNIMATAPTDRPTVGLDLPFTIGDNGFGYWLLRYYQSRTPAFGIGFDASFVNAFGFTNKARAAFLMMPSSSGTELNWAYRFSLEEARIPLLGAELEDRWSDIQFGVSLTRGDSVAARELRGFSGAGDRQTVFDFSAKWSAARYNIITQSFGDPLFNVDLVANAVWNHSSSPISAVQYQPELRFSAGKPLLLSFAGLSLSSWKWSAGWITAPVDTLNPSAVRLANGQSSVTAFKFSFGYALSLERPLWTGATVSGAATFTGQYYSTRNSASTDPTNPDFNGEIERNIVFSANLTARQTVGTALDVSLGGNYDVSQGESPFAFDRVQNRSGGGAFNSNLNWRPATWFTLTASENYGFTLNYRNASNNFNGVLEPLRIGANFTPRPIALAVNLQHNLETGTPVAYDLRLTGNDTSNSYSFSVAFGYQYPTATRATGAYNDLSLAAGYNSPNRAFTISFNVLENIQTAQVKSFGISSTAIFNGVEKSVTISINQNFIPWQGNTGSKLNGSIGLRYTFPSTEFDRPMFSSINVLFSNSFDYTPFVPTTPTAVPNSNINLQISLAGDFPIDFRFSSKLDIKTLVAYDTTLNVQFGSLTARGSSFDASLGFTLRFPDTISKEWLWTGVRLRLGWDARAGLSFFADIDYSRSLDFRTGIFTDTFSVKTLGFAIAFQILDSQRPNLFVAVTVSQTFAFSDNPKPITTTPLQPAFIIILDQCCYSLTFSLKPVNTNYIFSVVLSLPYGTQSLLEIDAKDGLRLPLLPFIEPIKPPK